MYSRRFQVQSGLRHSLTPAPACNSTPLVPRRVGSHGRFTSVLTLSALAIVASACGFSGDDMAGSGPIDEGPPGGPVGPPTTGGKWEGHENTDACGRTTIAYRIVDEVCAGTDAADYLEHFRAPIMRDGARIGDRLYAADATHLWVLDVTTPSEPVRTALLTGFGQPLATAVHDGRLLLAAADEGLIIADVSSPDAPTRLQTIETSGPALDVFVDGDLAYVATGKGGLLVVRLGATSEVIGEIPLPGFTAAVAVQGDVAYVAACDAFLTVDTATGAVLGETWVDEAYDADGILVAPAKDVFASESGIYVAAGRYGAVRVDATDPAAPSVVGNCTLRTEVGFYASGVRAQGERLFIAGGEWGILPVDLDDGSCTEIVRPDPIPAPPGSQPDENGECSSQPPWEVLPWEDTWLPPVQAGQDPLQTLPDGDVLYAFGDATRIGMRAVDVRLPEAEDLVKVGRYEEPRAMTAIAAHGNRVLVVGNRGGVFQRDGATLEIEVESPAFARSAVDGVFIEDGRWVLAMPEPRRVTVEGGQVVNLDGVYALWPGTMATQGNEVIVSDEFGVVVADFDAGTLTPLYSDRIAELPAAVVGLDDRILVAAPEWTQAVSLRDGAGPTLYAAHGIFGEQDIASVDAWRAALPHRLLARFEGGALELATLGRRAGLARHSGGAPPIPVELPPGEYVGLASTGDRAYAVSLDRGTYRSQLVTLDISSDPPRIVGVEAWTGMAAGVAATAEGIFVADRDIGVRIYDPLGDGVSLAGVVDLAEVGQ
jgi:hypothetical protein